MSPDPHDFVNEESESKSSESPIPGDKPEGIVEPPAAKTREEAAKAKKERQQDGR